MGVIIFHASFDSFAEQDQLVQLCNEKAAEAESMKRSFYRKHFTPVIAIGLCLLAVGILFTHLLIKIKWYVLLYVVNVIGLFAIVYNFTLLLWH